ncbi:MAG TPA: hypothetical protein VMR37_07670, partial [Rhabdochlamydiaceae bacterium]|nr:hypothetical protein [Rhabdochlamydiaceae bacterium]
MSIVRTGFNAVSSLCYNHRWEIAKAIPIPLSIGLTLAFRASWLLDPYTNYRGIACATAFNTVAYFVSHLVFQKGWLSYWERINAEATQESTEASAVRESTKAYEQAKLVLEKAHTAIREIRLKLENATRDKALEVAQSKAAFAAFEKKAQGTQKVRDEFIVGSIFPAITGLEKNNEIAKLVEEEAQNENSKIPSVLRRLCSILEELRLTIHNSEANNKQTLNIPQAKEKLSSIVGQFKQILFELSGNNEELSKQIIKDEETLQKWKKKELPASQDRLSENSRLKFSEEEQKKDLAADLEKKSEKMRTLETEIQQVEPQEAKKQYEIADRDCRKNEVELGLLQSGDVKKPLPSEDLDRMSLSLASLSELNERLQIQRQAAEKAQEEADRLRDSWKKAAELMGAALKEHRELIARYLLAWKSGLHQEIENKKKRAEDPSGFLSAFLGSNQDESEVKKQKQPKIEAYFSELSLVLNEWKVQNDQDLSSIVRSHSFRLPIEIPDWHDNEMERFKRIAQFRKNVKLIQELDLIFPCVMSMCAYFEQTNHESKELKNSELQVHFSNFSAFLYPLGDDFNNKYSAFKRLTGLYFHQDHLKDYAKQQFNEIEAEIELRRKESSHLKEHLGLLSRVRETKKVAYVTQNREYLKKRGEYLSLQEQIADIDKEVKKIDENSSRIEKTLELNRKNVQEIKEIIQKLTMRIEDNKKEFARNKSKLEILTPEKAKIEALADTSATHDAHPSLLEQLDLLQEAFQLALKEAEAAKGAWENKRAVLSQNTKDLTEAEEKSIAERDSKKQQLETVQKKFAESIGGLMKAQCNTTRYTTFLSIRDKCQSAIKFYQWKQNLSKEVTKETTKKTTEKGIALQNNTTQMIQHKIQLALTKRSMNLEKARLGNLSHPHEMSEIDTA